MRRISEQAFTLPELLISLLIIAQIATFTIPKVLNAQQNQSWRAKTKEAIGTISQAYQVYTLQNGYNTGLDQSTLFKYMNHVRIDTSSSIDGPTGWGQFECSWGQCLVLHNGAYLYGTVAWDSFGGSASTNYLSFIMDPDGKVSGNGAATASLMIVLYYNGRVVSGTECRATDITYAGPTPTNCTPQTSPSWFSW